jgi:hypothetical protein
MLFDPLSYREVGKYPISIGTSLAIESITGIHDDRLGKVDVLEYDCLWLNIRTLLRNMLGAMKSVSGPTPGASDYAESLVSEIESITQTVSEVSINKCRVMCYYSNYSEVERKHKGAVVRVFTTDKQKETFRTSKEILLKLFQKIKERNIPFIGINDLITGQPPSKNLILTHYAYDLLANSSNFKLTLVESHTGAVKSKALWHTKYLDGKNLPMIPFNRLFLQVFGDKETFRPMDHKLRKEIVDTATQYRWNSNTSMSMINYSLSQLKNPFAKDFLKSLAH